MIIHRNIDNILTDDDYGIQGEYLVSIWTDNGLLGEEKDNNYNLTRSGEIIKKLWNSIPEHFDNVVLKDYIICNDRFYGILEIDIYGKKGINNKPVYNSISYFEITFGLLISRKNPFLTEGSIFHIINWLKASSLIECQKNDPQFCWKSGYYEYKIQNDTEDQDISDLLKRQAS